MAFFQSVSKPALAVVGSFLCLIPSVQALALKSGNTGVDALSWNRSETNNLQQPRSGRLTPILLAQDRAVCGLDGGIVRRFETTNYRIFICENQNSGDFTYVGAKKGSETTNNIFLPLRSAVNDTYVAVNGEYRYVINAKELVVTRNGRVIGRERVLTSGI